MQKNIIQYRIKYDATKAVGGGLDFCDLCTEFTRIKPVKNILRRSLERANIIDYRLNEGKKTRRIRNNNKIIIDPNHNQEIILLRQVLKLEAN